MNKILSYYVPYKIEGIFGVEGTKRSGKRILTGELYDFLVQNEKYFFKPYLHDVKKIFETIEFRGEKVIPVDYILHFEENMTEEFKERKRKEFYSKLILVPYTLCFKTIISLLEMKIDVFLLIKKDLAYEL